MKPVLDNFVAVASSIASLRKRWFRIRLFELIVKLKVLSQVRAKLSRSQGKVDGVGEF